MTMKLRSLRLAALLLGSSLFFPVSCTSGLVAGTHIISLMEARDSTKGDKPHFQAYLVAALPGSPQQLKAFPLVELDKFRKENPEHSFLLPVPSGKFATDTQAKVSFAAIPSIPGKQIVEVTLDDDTGTFFRYEATHDTINPLYTRLWYHGYMFGAIPYALAFAAALLLLGKYMRRRLKQEIPHGRTPNG